MIGGRRLHLHKSHWKRTISNCYKTRYYIRHKSTIKVYAKSEPSTVWSSKKILRYLRGTKEFGIWYRSTNDARLVGFANSDCAGLTDDMKSTSDYHFSLGSGISSWASMKQATVAQSLVETESIAVAATSNQATWL
ncbi:UNVERIFIED_CONTAM: Retrovirus-related Pol polyprotein from transposon RE2 [Sesamum radiatum]|uniref:Retrovirus-related Pol polyprotein from transposon RE2 n=1 Tax=Sesamum radiatum TaxID=300843 RepID=A0AAW2TIS8_SESRA